MRLMEIKKTFQRKIWPLILFCQKLPTIDMDWERLVITDIGIIGTDK
jgi:hypothetical protein